jgi:hypothetical protein
MSEGYTVEDIHGETIGIVVRNERGHGFRFFSSARAFDVLDGQIFANARAAERAAHDIDRRKSAPRTRDPWRAEAIA